MCQHCVLVHKWNGDFECDLNQRVVEYFAIKTIELEKRRERFMSSLYTTCIISRLKLHITQ